MIKKVRLISWPRMEKFCMLYNMSRKLRAQVRNAVFAIYLTIACAPCEKYFFQRATAKIAPYKLTAVKIACRLCIFLFVKSKIQTIN